MCIAIYKPAGRNIPRSTLARCWSRHPHGAGFAVPNNQGGIKIRKSMSWQGFYKAWAEDAHVDRPMVVHFRYATHGARNIRNCHPHRVSRDLVMIHNGVIRRMTRYATSKKSDTSAFVERVLKDLSVETVYSDGGVRLLQDYVGNSKLVFLDSAGRPQIVGEEKGTWEGGLWYSNKTYRRPLRTRPAKKSTPKAKSPSRPKPRAKPLTDLFTDPNRWPEPSVFQDEAVDDDWFWQSDDDGRDLYDSMYGRRGVQGRLSFEDMDYEPDPSECDLGRYERSGRWRR